MNKKRTNSEKLYLAITDNHGTVIKSFKNAGTAQDPKLTEQDGFLLALEYFGIKVTWAVI